MIIHSVSAFKASEFLTYEGRAEMRKRAACRRRAGEYIHECIRYIYL
jgi:hypothetical protein